MKIWSEKNGRADIIVYGYSALDIVFVFLAALIVLAGCIASIVVLS